MCKQLLAILILLLLTTATTANPRLTNISTRGDVGTGDNVLIGGFIISGTEEKTLVLRARGPSLSAADPTLQTLLQDPHISVFSGASLIDSNDDWRQHENSTLLPPSLQPSEEKEAALLMQLKPGAYTVIVSGSSDELGLAIVEAFEVTDSGLTRFINISTRGLVGLSDNVLIGGLVISGERNKSVTIRARGPSLKIEAPELGQILSNPSLQLFDSQGTLIDSNDSWREHRNSGSVKPELIPNSELEAVITTNLAPGAYTAIVRGNENGTGIAIVEIFESTSDLDEDGVLDSEDSFPLNFAESIDTDSDGIGNNEDPDDDNDSLLDELDELPLDKNFAPFAEFVSINSQNLEVIVGQTLTVEYSYRDKDGDLELSSEIQWTRNGRQISGATTESYIVEAEDSGKQLRAVITPKAKTGVRIGSESYSNVVNISNSGPTATNILIVDINGGSAIVGDTLQVSYNYDDIDGDLEQTSEIYWTLNGSVIANALSQTYVIRTTDSNKQIRAVIRPKARSGATEGVDVKSNLIDIANSKPTASNVQIVDVNGGSAIVGDTLQVSYNYDDIDGDLEQTSEIYWTLNGSVIANALSQTYVIRTTDSNKQIRAVIRPKARSGATEGVDVKSNLIDIANSKPTASNVQIVDVNGGSAIVGDTLQVSYNYDDIDGDLEQTSEIYWTLNGSVIPDASSQTYVIRPTDGDKQIRAVVHPKASSGVTHGLEFHSNSVDIFYLRPTVSNVKIVDVNGGNPIVGDILRVTYTYNGVGEGDTEGETVKQWLSNGVKIDGADDVEFVLTNAQVPSKMSLKLIPVSRIDSVTGYPITTDSLATGTPPRVTSAVYRDNNANAVADTGDEIAVSFDQKIVPNSFGVQEFSFSDETHTFGEGATTDVGADNRSIRIELGANAKLRAKGDGPFSSSIDFTGTSLTGSIESLSGKPASAQGFIDVKPTFLLVHQFNLSGSQGAMDSLLFDADTDRDLDLVLLSQSENFLLLNEGSGRFPGTSQALGTYGLTWGADSGDVDNDGDMDFVTTNTLTEPGRTYYNDGNGNFDHRDLITDGFDSGVEIILFHSNGDSNLDLALAYFNSGVKVFLNDGAGLFSDTGQELGGGGTDRGLINGDIDSDGDEDLIVISHFSISRTYTNDGTGSFTEKATLPINGHSGDIADIDGDGDLDLVTITFNGPVRVFKNDGDGNFEQSVGGSFGNRSGGWDVKFLDFDGDGDKDIIDVRTTVMNFFSNDGMGNFTKEPTLSLQKTESGTASLINITLGDIDGDGDLDLIQTINGEGIKVYKSSLESGL